jgi:hypothetical protein
MASFAQSTHEGSSDDDRVPYDCPIQIMCNMAAMTTSTQRQTRNARRKMQRKKANSPAFADQEHSQRLQKHPFWHLLSPSEYCKLIEGWDWDLIAGQDTTAEMRLRRTPPPDVATNPASSDSNLVYETWYASVLVTANMMNDELLILSHPPTKPTPPKIDGGDSGLPPPPFLLPKEVDPTSPAGAPVPQRPNLTRPAESPVPPRPKSLDGHRSRFNAPASHDWRDPNSPFFETKNKVRETIVKALPPSLHQGIPKGRYSP